MRKRSVAVGLLIVISMIAMASSACRKSKNSQLEADAGAEAAATYSSGLRARELLVAYAAQHECASRKPFILNPDRNLSLLLAKTGASCTGTDTYRSLDVSDCEGGFENAAQTFCIASAVYPKESRAYCLVKTPDGLKIDWRCSVGYGPMTIQAFKARVPDLPVLFRANAKLSDYFNYGFSKAQRTHYSIELNDAAGDIIHAYIAKSSTDAERLFRIVEDSKLHSVLVELTYPAGADPSTAAISRFIHNDWTEGPDGN